MDLPKSARRFEERAAQRGLEITIRSMPDSTRTAEEAAQACGTEVGQIVKSLVFEKATTGTPVLLLVSGVNRVDEARVAAALGEDLARPNGRRVRAITGYAIGGIPPLGHDTELETFIDPDLMRYSEVWAAAGTPHAVFAADPQELAKACGARVLQMA